MANSKSKATISLDPHIWDQFKNETNSASRKIEELCKTWLNTQGNEIGELHDRQEELMEELQELKEHKKKTEQRISSVESELESVEAAIEEQDKEQERVEEAVDSLADTLMEKRRIHGSLDKALGDLSTTQMYHSWLEQLEISSDRLKKRLKAEVDA